MIINLYVVKANVSYLPLLDKVMSLYCEYCLIKLVLALQFSFVYKILRLTRKSNSLILKSLLHQQWLISDPLFFAIDNMERKSMKTSCYKLSTQKLVLRYKSARSRINSF